MIPKAKGLNKPGPQIKAKPQKFFNVNNSPLNNSSQVNHIKQNSDFFLPSQNKNEKIIHHSVRRNFDDEGNAIVTTKIVREVDLDEGETILNSNSILNMRSKSNFGTFYSNNEQENDNLYFSNNEEQENTSGRPYNNKNFIFSPSSYNSYENSLNNRFNNYNSNVIDSDGGRNYFTGYRNTGNRDYINLQNSEISAVLPNYTSGSDFEDQRSPNKNNFEKNQNPNVNTSQTIELNKIKYKKYNLENPQYKSINNNFYSPDRNLNDRYIEYYRNNQANQIKGAIPIYQEYHEKYSPRNNQFEASDEYDTNMSMNMNRYIKRKSIPNSSKIYGFQRNYPSNKETYDIINEMATLIQSHIRGFLARKKVLRYITLAIFYQSFCDKIQDVLCCHVKEEIFNLLKQKLKIKSKNDGKIKKESALSLSKKKRKQINSYNNSFKNIFRINFR